MCQYADNVLLKLNNTKNNLDSVLSMFDDIEKFIMQQAKKNVSGVTCNNVSMAVFASSSTGGNKQRK